MKRLMKKIGIAISSSGVFAVMLTGVAHAQASAIPSWYNWATSPGTSAIMLISVVINYILSFAVSLGGILINFGLGLDQNVFLSPTVQTGFSVALSIANLGFVLGIIVIAIATILRSQSYGIKQVLWKLVVMAILVNFGLVITGPIVGLADNFSGYFLQAMGGRAQFATSLTTAFAPSAFTTAPVVTSASTGVTAANAACNTLSLLPGLSTICQIAVGKVTGTDTTGAGDFMRAVTSGIFSAVFIGIAAFTLILVGILLLVRYVYLNILLILLPLAWLTWIFPKFNYFSKWWGLFLKWSLFPAIVLFFLYIAVQSVSLVNGQVTVPAATIAAGDLTQNSNPYVSAAIQSGQIGWFQTALDELVLVGLCLGGIFAANSLSLQGADTIMHGAKWVGGQVQGYVGRRANSGRKNVTDRIRSAGKKYNPETRESTTALQRFGSKMQGIPIPGLRAVGTTLSNKAAPAAFHGERKEEIKKYVDENLKNLTNEGLITRATSATAFINPTQSAAIAQEIARRNLTTDAKIAPLMDRYVEVADKMGTLESVTNNRPDLMPPREKPASAGGGMETQEEATARAVRSAKGEIIQANPEIFHAVDPAAASAKLGNPKVTKVMLENAVLNLSPAQLGTLGSDLTAGSQERQNNITESVKSLVAPFRKAILDPATKMPTGKYELDTAALATAAKTRKELTNLEKIVKHMENSPNWGSVINS